MKCPHEHIQYCPLYVAAHEYPLSLHSCIFGKAMDDPTKRCAVEFGEAIYAKLILEVARADPRMVAQCRFAEQARQDKEQRARNMRMAGIH